jgi:hypothetical protein
MKLLQLIAICCCLYVPTLAQTKHQGQLFLKDKCGQIHLSLSPKRVTSKEKIPPYFAGFEVVDFRQDTSRLGFWAIDKDRREFVFQSTASQTISSFLDNYVDPAGTRTFLIVIKKLWLCDVKDNTLNPRQTRSWGSIEFRGEAFLKTNQGYLPFTYLDTVITSPNSARDMAIFRLSDLLFNFISKIAAVNEEVVLKRKATYSFHVLDSLNKERFNYPMDTALVLKKGVYANVDEFRNNQPSIFNYDIRPDENGFSQLYLTDEKGKPYFSRKMWGYCDGQQCYAMMDGNLFPVLSIDHAFYVFGSKEYKIKKKIMPVLLFVSPLMLATMPISETATRKLHFFSLDPYTGKID